MHAQMLAVCSVANLQIPDFDVSGKITFIFRNQKPLILSPFFRCMHQQEDSEKVVDKKKLY